jgi:hypothetical protein
MKESFPKTDVRYWRNQLYKKRRVVAGKTYVDKNWSVQIGYQNRQEAFPLSTASKAQALARRSGHLPGADHQRLGSGAHKVQDQR